MLKKEHKIKSTDKIDFINKKIINTNLFKVVFGIYKTLNNTDIITKSEMSNTEIDKVRVIISNKINKKSVIRNKIKRRIYYFFLENNILKEKNIAYIITVIKKSPQAPKYNEIEKELLFLK